VVSGSGWGGESVVGEKRGFGVGDVGGGERVGCVPNPAAGYSAVVVAGEEEVTLGKKVFERAGGGGGEGRGGSVVESVGCAAGAS